jgi:type VI secretion system protein ImpH
MGAAGREPDTSLTESLRAAPQRFDFIQAVRIIERAASLRARDPRFSVPGPIGHDNDPQHEALRLRAALELAFPAAEVAAFDDAKARPELSVTLMGLNGVSGVLPSQYSQLVLEAARGKNTALRDFLDIFNHRALSLFVRAARKYRLHLAYEYAGSDSADAISTALLALIGMRQGSLRRRQAVVDEALVFYGGHFAHRPRTASALEQLLSDYFGLTVAVLQFHGRWVDLPAAERTRLGGPKRDPGCYATLGTSALVGSRSWDAQGAFRLRLGPLRYAAFLEFMPNGTQLAELAALVRSYVGPTLTFDVQLTLRADEVPPLALSGDWSQGSRLGWNTWLPMPDRLDDPSGATFEPRETPGAVPG